MKRKSTARLPRGDSAARTPISASEPVAPAPGHVGHEELRRINEELETSQEELESANEELRTFNEEMTMRNAELSTLNADLHNLQLNASTALVVLGRDGTVRSFTPLAKQPFNLRATDVGRPLGDIRHQLHAPASGEPADAPPGREALPLDLEGIAREVIACETSRSQEVQDHAGHWFSLSVRPYVTLEQKIDGAVLVLADIDALKRSERAASVAREYAEAMLRTTRDPLLVLRSDLCVNTASEAFYKVFRTTAAEAEGRSFWELDDGKWKDPRLRELLHEVLPRHSFFNEYEVVRDLPGIGLRTLLLNARPLDPGTGAAEMILLGIEDVTERRRLDDAVRLSEERYRTLFNSIDEGFCVVELRVDTAGHPADVRFLEVNPAFEKQCGLRNATGKWISELVPELDPHWLEAIGQVALTGQAARFEDRFQAFDRWLDVYAFRLGGPESCVVAILFSDTTERRRKAQELERTHDEAVEAARAKDDFLATLSHELRTPLSPVLLLASEAADDRNLPESVRADFAAIASGIALEARLIDDLLDLTRVARGKLRLELGTCQVESVLRDAIGVVAAEVDAKHIQLVLNLHASRTDVRGDPVRLQQVFWNVLRNAVHFTPDGGRIEVESRTDPADAELTIAISDTGIGIAPDDLTRIFDAFNQGGVVAGASRGGLGLGLAISRTMVELHAGSIHATSSGPGLGSTFVVTLPLLARGSPLDRPVVASSALAGRGALPAVPAGACAAAPRSVLVVDDHAPTRVALRRLLERRNYVVHTAASISEARALGLQHPIDVLISDIGLPDGDGRVLMNQLRGRIPELRGIALSGFGMEADLAKSRLAGFADHLIKPVTVAMVDRAIAKLTFARPVENALSEVYETPP